MLFSQEKKSWAKGRKKKIMLSKMFMENYLGFQIEVDTFEL